MRGVVLQTRLFGATAAVHYGAVSRTMATFAVGWSHVVRLGYPDDFGDVARDARILMAPGALARLNAILRFGLEIEKPESGAPTRSLGVTVKISFAEEQGIAPLSISGAREEKLTRAATLILNRQEVYIA